MTGMKQTENAKQAKQTERVGCFMICKNAAAEIGRALESVSALDEIVVVVDSATTDETAEIARARGAKVFHREWTNFSEQKQFALERMESEWVLNLDADERASAALIRELRAFAASGRGAGLKIPRREWQFGRWQSAGTRMNALVRFFRRDLARYGAETVHERVVLEGELFRARGVIFHCGERTLADKTAKGNLYSTLRAGERAKQGKRGSVWRMVFSPLFAFFRSYVLRRTFLDGWRGFANAAANAHYAFLKEAKLLEKTDPPESDQPPEDS